MCKFTTASPEETASLGKRILEELRGCSFIALCGDLGAGKTTFVKGMVQSLLPEAIVTSPTYNIVNSYECGEVFIHHYDMYRISDDDDLYSVGFYDDLDNGIVVAEWCENIPWAIPEKHVRVTINKDPQNDDIRHIEWEFCKC